MGLQNIHLTIGEVRTNSTTIGIDLAKTSFSLVGANQHNKIVRRKTLTRNKLMSFIAQYPPCVIGLEACSGAHYWARELEKLGHEVKIIAVKAARMTTMTPRQSAKPFAARISGMCR